MLGREGCSEEGPRRGAEMELRGRGLLARALEWSSCLAVSFKCSWECSAGNWATAPRASHCPPRPYSTPLHLHLQRPNLRCPPFLRRVSLSFPRVDHWPCGLPTARHRWVHRSVALASLRLLSGAKYWGAKGIRPGEKSGRLLGASLFLPLLGVSVHEIFQAIVLEWVAISFSRGSSQLRDRTWASRIVDRCFYRMSHQGSPTLSRTIINIYYNLINTFN